MVCRDSAEELLLELRLELADIDNHDAVLAARGGP